MFVAPFEILTSIFLFLFLFSTSLSAFSQFTQTIAFGLPSTNAHTFFPTHSRTQSSTRRPWLSRALALALAKRNFPANWPAHNRWHSTVFSSECSRTLQQYNSNNNNNNNGLTVLLADLVGICYLLLALASSIVVIYFLFLILSLYLNNFLLLFSPLESLDTPPSSPNPSLRKSYSLFSLFTHTCTNRHSRLSEAR